MRSSALLAVVLAFVPPTVARVQERHELGRPPTAARVTPDAKRFVFAAPDEENESGKNALFSVPVEGGTPTRIGGPLGSPVGSPWSLTPDGRRVVYVSGALFAAPVDGSSAPLALGATGAGERALDFVLGADGERVVYRASAGDAYAGLFSVALDGVALDSASAPVELVAPNAHGDVRDFAIAPDGQSVVFTSVHADGGNARLYVVPITGGAPLELHPRGLAGGSVHDFHVTADGTRVLFRAPAAASERLALYTVPLDTVPFDGAVELSDPLAPAADVQAFAPSADGAWVLFLAARGNGQNDLCSARTDASEPPVCLSAALSAEGCVAAGFALDPGSARVVFAADPAEAERFELFVSALDGRSPPLRLDAPSDAGSVGWYAITPDGERAVYEQHESDSTSVLRAVSLVSGTAFELGRGSAASDFRLDPSGRSLVYLEHGSTLCILALDGGAATHRTELAAQLTGDGLVDDLALAPDGRFALVRDDSRWLRVPLDGDGPVLVLNTPPAPLPGDEAPAFVANPSGGGGRIAATGDVGFRDFSFGTTGSSTPTGEKPESKLWWNDGVWWGSLYTDSAQAYHVWRLQGRTWTDTGTTLDDRGSTKADVLWDSAARKLYVASHIFTTTAQATTSNWARLYRYSYNASSQTYARDAGFPVDISRGNAEALTIAKDSSGHLWATWVQSSQVWINHSGTSDTDWGAPFVLPASSSAVNVSAEDISAVIAFGGNKVGVIWSNQLTSTTYFAVHLDSDSATHWQPVEAVVPDGSCTGACSDDHFSLKTAAGFVFVALKTSHVGESESLVLVCKRTPAGDWSSTPFGLVQDHHTRPILLLDEEHAQLYVFATHPEAGGAIYFKSSPAGSVHFASGLGTPFLQNSTDLKINNATSTKQNLNGQTDLVVLASDQDSHVYLHNFIDLAGGGGGGGAPTISSFSPGNGPVGTNVVLNGTNFTGTTAVRFNGTNAAFSVASSTRIDTRVPTGATTGRITVTTPAGTATSSSDFGVTQSGPTITSFSPSSGPVGTNVAINGTNFTGASSVQFNGRSAGFRVSSSTRIDTQVPAGATTGRISVTTPSGTATSSSNFGVTQSGPTITSFSPSSGPVGTNVAINGANFTGASAVQFNGRSAGFRVSSSTRIDTQVPAGATTGRISVTTGSGTATSSNNFTVLQAPTIRSFSPSRGPSGTNVSLDGEHFADVSEVRINGAVASFAIRSDTRIDLKVPSNATTGRITVKNRSGSATSSSDFVVTQPPVIFSFTPNVGIVATPVTIKGIHFRGATRVEFNGKSATIVGIVNDDTIFTLVPLGASTGKIRVTTPDGTGESSSVFTVIGL